MATEELALLPRVLREYALLGDGERGALVGPSGEITWMCFPGWADDGLFAAQGRSEALAAPGGVRCQRRTARATPGGDDLVHVVQIGSPAPHLSQT